GDAFERGSIHVGQAHVQARLAVGDAKGTPVVGCQGGVDAGDLVVIHVVLVVMDEVVPVVGLATIDLPGEGAKGQGNTVQQVHPFVIGDLQLVVHLVRQPQPGIGNSDIEGFGVHVDRIAQPSGPQGQAVGRFPGQVQPVEIQAPAILIRRRGDLGGSNQVITQLV